MVGIQWEEALQLVGWAHEVVGIQWEASQLVGWAHMVVGIQWEASQLVALVEKHEADGVA